jgi:hypothetical protein
VWRMSCQRKFSMPARLSAFLQAFVLAFASGFPAYVNTLCECLPSYRRNTSSAVAFSGTAIGLPYRAAADRLHEACETARSDPTDHDRGLGCDRPSEQVLHKDES